MEVKLSPFQNPLIEVAEIVRHESQKAKVAVIFDLDSTLFCVSPRTEAILRQLHADPGFRELFPHEYEILADVSVLPTDWGYREALAGYSPSPNFRQAVEEYWVKHFFSSPALVHDRIYPCANEYVRKLHSLGAEVLYLTGRPEGPMREGTIRSLKSFNFPLEESLLLMKPSHLESDEGYKAQVLNRLAGEYAHIWFFENEPVIIERVRRQLPQVRIIFMNSVHSGKATPPEDLPTIAMDFSGGLK